MIYSITYNILISLSIIIFFHYVYIYFINYFTKPKMVDMIYQPNNKYTEILDKIHTENTLPIETDKSVPVHNKKDDETVSTNMVDELQLFLTSQISSTAA